MPDIHKLGDFRLRNLQPSDADIYDEVNQMIEEANNAEGFFELSDDFALDDYPDLKNKIIEIMNPNKNSESIYLIIYRVDKFNVYLLLPGTDSDSNDLLQVHESTGTIKDFFENLSVSENEFGEHYILYSSKPDPILTSNPPEDKIFLGGNVRGYQPQLLGGGANSSSGSGMVGSNERGMSRTMLRKSFGRTNWLDDVTNKKNANKSTPFRVAMNAGDINGTKNASPMKELKPPNQVNGVNALMGRLYGIGDGVKHGGAAYSGNPNYVYDSSDYIRYKKLGAKLKTYNTISFGGPPKSSNPFLMAMRK